MRVLVVGCGYVGFPLGEELVRQGHEVYGLRRSATVRPNLSAVGIRPIAGDITSAEVVKRLPGPFDWVVSCVSSGRGGGADQYRQVYYEGTKNLIDWLSKSSLQKFVYISSTSVYGQKDASAASEESPTEPESDTGRIVVETEQLLLEAARQHAFPAVVLRAAGIYGPDRGYLFQQYLKDAVKITGDPNRYLNMIHRDDLVGIIINALQHGRPGQVYNAVDNEPVPQIAFFRWLSKVLGKGMPPYADESESYRSKRGVTNKQVLNKKMKAELGYQLKYPTFREGFTAEIERLREEKG